MVHANGGPAVPQPHGAQLSSNKQAEKKNKWMYVGVSLVFACTLYAFYFLLYAADSPHHHHQHHVTPAKVFWSAWITAAATGLGMSPFLFTKEFDKRWVAFGNAVASGMMISASMGLLEEGAHGTSADASLTRVAIGFCFGFLFIRLSKSYLDGADAFHVTDLDGADARSATLILFVMTLHSLSEGVGLGVSYHSASLGSFISATLAVHNIPEGVAIAVVLLPRGVMKSQTFLWCVFSSLPQPFMAVPAFLFVEAFRPLFALGLGFAAGAMLYVAIFELLQEASETISQTKALVITMFAAIVMATVQVALREDLNGQTGSERVDDPVFDRAARWLGW